MIARVLDALSPARRHRRRVARRLGAYCDYHARRPLLRWRGAR